MVQKMTESTSKSVARLHVTDHIRQTVQDALSHNAVSIDDKILLQGDLDTGSLSIKAVEALCRFSNQSLPLLLSGSKLVFSGFEIKKEEVRGTFA